MNSDPADIEQPPSRQAPNLSRSHPSAQGRPAEEQDPPAGEDLKKDGWVQAPSELRPAPSAFLPARSPLTEIPRLVVPKPKTFSGDATPPVDQAVPILQNQAHIIEHLHRGTSIVLKAGFGFLAVFTIFLAFRFGESCGKETALREAPPAPAPTPPPKDFPEELLPELDTALNLLRKGENLDALAALNKMVASHSDAPSVHYAAAIAALQSGYPREAERLADASIARGSRVSDSWALKAAIVAIKSKASSPEQEILLKKAIASDPMNPSPFVELASFLRAQGKTDEVSVLLESAIVRFNPADSRIVVETTRAVLAVDIGEKLVPPAQPVGIPVKDFPNAYSEMKRGNYEHAAAILRFCRDQTDPDLFAYLVNDSALRKFASRQEFAEFY